MEKRIIISRTDNIGDVILTLPLAGILKSHFPNSTIIFLGKGYTIPIIKKCKWIDQVEDWNELKTDFRKFKALGADSIVHVFPNLEIAKWANRAKIQIRIGTSHRWYHWLYCNKKVSFSRKNSNLHEAELNQNLLLPLGIKTRISNTELAQYYGWKKANREFNEIDQQKTNVILHCKSKGSAKNWPLASFLELVHSLPKEQFHFFITGTLEEGKAIRQELPALLAEGNVQDVSGAYTLTQFIDFIGCCDALVAASTGPLHIAAASGITTIGLYPLKRPMHAGRWGAIGQKVHIISEDDENEEEQLIISHNPICDILKLALTNKTQP